LDLDQILIDANTSEAAHITQVADELNIPRDRVEATAKLLGEGATVPFIARYRKEATGSLDEVAITAIRDRLAQLAELRDRRNAILKSLIERDLLTPELHEQVLAAKTMAELEDVYLPYRPKRRTRATIAKEKGLEPLADLILAQEIADPEHEALAFVDPEKGVESASDAIAGASDIIAERISEDQETRGAMRKLYQAASTLRSRAVSGKETEGAKYQDYFEWEEPVYKIPSHRILAMFRGEKEGFLSLKLSPPEDEALELLDQRFVTGDGPASEIVSEAAKDGYRRLLGPSMETELRQELKRRADAEAIKVFADNLRQLLLAPPLGHKNVMAIDPGFRTGCKVVCLDRQGRLLYTTTIYPHSSERAAQEAAQDVYSMCRMYDVEVIAVGNGTAGRETQAFLQKLELPNKPPIVMVNESGASVYSASEAAREEFPDYDLTVRGAVSIGRRLMDPLAELVKIDPKAIGVGQYQHDVDQAALKQSLDDVVISCVNAVGVDVNSASKQLLTYVSGVGPTLASRIVEYRNANGPFKSREELKKIKGFGPKTFQQAAGFLRIPGASNPLDASAVHPESYHIVNQMADDLKCSVKDLIESQELRDKIDLEKYVTDTVGMPTLTDIMSELAKPGRDPRDKFEIVQFAEGINTIEDLKPGMVIPGVVTNITAFGAFVDIGVHQDGLVHISEMSDSYVRSPWDVVRLHQRVTVRVLDVDLQRQRISLTMKGLRRL
jgi:uncharacterized protein